MFKFQITKNADVTAQLLDGICNIKSIAWPYNIESQKNWIKQNLLGEDLHVLMYSDTKLVAYLNLVHVNLEVDGINIKAMGVGNVCASEKSMGYGGKLLLETNRFLLKEKVVGILFCKEYLVDFYSKYDWKPFLRKNISFKKAQEITFETMLFNAADKIGKIVYSDRFF